MVTQWVIATLIPRFGSFKSCQGLHDGDYNVLNLYICSSIWLKLPYIVTPIAGELMDGCLFCEWLIQIDIVYVMLRSRQCGQCIHQMIGKCKTNTDLLRQSRALVIPKSARHERLMGEGWNGYARCNFNRPCVCVYTPSTYDI